MLINAEPKKFNITFKGEEINLVRKALMLHRVNPGTRQSKIKLIDNLIRQHNMFPKRRIMNIEEIKAIIYGIALIIATKEIKQETLELGLHLISAMNNAVDQDIRTLWVPVPFYAGSSNDNK